MAAVEFKAGDRVYVTDPGLAQLREIMRNATDVEPPPNHHGTVDRVWGDSVLITFDDTGSAAPYPPAEVRHLEPSPKLAITPAELAEDLADAAVEDGYDGPMP